MESLILRRIGGVRVLCFGHDMSTLGASIVVKGELRSTDDLTIEGLVEGDVFCEAGSVVIASSARIGGDVLARDITVFGRSDGQLVATEVVDIRAAAAVSGQVVSPRFILDEAASFNGRVAPQMLEAAIRVAHYQRRPKTGDGATMPAASAKGVR
jgi:cytoskeletal protein CcmA (bactofilin family)